MDLRELERRPQRDVGGVDRDERAPPPGDQVAIGRAVEELPVVELGDQVAAAEPRRSQPEPVAGREQAPEERALHVALEEALLELLEDVVAAERVVGGGEAAPGDGGDVVDLVEQPAAAALPGDFGARQLLEGAVGQCRGARAAAGEGEEQLQAVGIVARGDVAEPVASGRIDASDRCVHRIVGAAGGRGMRRGTTRARAAPRILPRDGSRSRRAGRSVVSSSWLELTPGLGAPLARPAGRTAASWITPRAPPESRGRRRRRRAGSRAGRPARRRARARPRRGSGARGFSTAIS